MGKTIIVFAISLLGILPSAAAPDDDAIRLLLHSTFDKPASRLIIDPVAVAAAYAVAGWSQGNVGGRALLHRRDGQWSLILCSGDGLKSPEALRQAGLSSVQATALSSKLAEAERHVTAERLALFATFEGTVMMDSSGGHPPDSHPGRH
jgi:hypothetical protein